MRLSDCAHAQIGLHLRCSLATVRFPYQLKKQAVLTFMRYHKMLNLSGSANVPILVHKALALVTLV